MVILNSILCFIIINQSILCYTIPAEEQKVWTSSQHDDDSYYIFGLIITRHSQWRNSHHKQAREQKHYSRRCYGLCKYHIDYQV